MVIGVCSILVMISIGIGLERYYDDMLASWGDLTMITVNDYSGKGALDDATVAKIQAIPGVEIATPFYQPWDLGLQFKTKDGRYVASPQIYGVYPRHWKRWALN